MRGLQFAAIAVCANLAVACGNSNPDEMMSEVEVTGCLTGTNDQFVLTELDRAETGTTIASPATETYKLIGEANTLRPHVGQQVRVSGMAETPDVAVVRRLSPPAPAAQPGVGTTGSNAPESNPGARPEVSTVQQTRLEVSTLHVRTVTPTGSACTP